MQSTIDHLSKRTRQYWLIDGLAEITIGCMFLFRGSQGHAAFYSLIGFALLASGCITLVFYRREHQDMGEEIQ